MPSCLIEAVPLPLFVPFPVPVGGRGLGLGGIFKVGTTDVGLFDGSATVNTGFERFESSFNGWEICQRPSSVDSLSKYRQQTGTFWRWPDASSFCHRIRYCQQRLLIYSPRHHFHENIGRHLQYPCFGDGVRLLYLRLSEDHLE